MMLVVCTWIESFDQQEDEQEEHERNYDPKLIKASNQKP